jgi:hypothetical protein
LQLNIATHQLTHFGIEDGSNTSVKLRKHHPQTRFKNSVAGTSEKHNFIDKSIGKDHDPWSVMLDVHVIFRLSRKSLTSVCFSALQIHFMPLHSFPFALTKLHITVWISSLSFHSTQCSTTWDLPFSADLPSSGQWPLVCIHNLFRIVPHFRKWTRHFVMLGGGILGTSVSLHMVLWPALACDLLPPLHLVDVTVLSLHFPFYWIKRYVETSLYIEIIQGNLLPVI